MEVEENMDREWATEEWNPPRLLPPRLNQEVSSLFSWHPRPFRTESFLTPLTPIPYPGKRLLGYGQSFCFNVLFFRSEILTTKTQKKTKKTTRNHKKFKMKKTTKKLHTTFKNDWLTWSPTPPSPFLLRILAHKKYAIGMAESCLF